MAKKIIARLFAILASLALVLGLSATASAQAVSVTVSGNNTTRPTFSFTMNESMTIEGLEFQIPNGAGAKLKQPNAFNLVKVNGTVVSRESSWNANNSETALSLTKNSATINVLPGSPIKVNAGDKIEVQLNFESRTNVNGATVSMSGMQDESDPVDPNPTPDPANPTEVTPVKPTAIAAVCGAKKQVQVPVIDGVRYEQFPHDTNSVRVKATPRTGYVFREGAETEWIVDLSPDTNCEINASRFAVNAHNGITITEPVTTPGNNSYVVSFDVKEDSYFQRIFLKADRLKGNLLPSYFSFMVEGFETKSIELRPKVLVETPDYVEIELVPISSEGKVLYAVDVPAGSTVSINTNFLAPDTHVDATIDLYGFLKEPETFEPVWVNADKKYIHDHIQNPAMPKRCGLRIAIVADLSLSVSFADDNAPYGYERMKEAAYGMLDSLKNTPVEVGIYNFGTYGPGNPDVNGWGTTKGDSKEYLPVDNKDNYDYLRSKIDQWGTLRYSFTNWQAGFEQLNGQDYDVVYFLTDGAPTASSEGSQKPYTHISDLNNAIDAANELKKNGTRIEPILIDFKLGNNRTYLAGSDLLLKDDVEIIQAGPNGELPLSGLKPNTLHIAVEEGHTTDANYPRTSAIANLYRQIQRAPQSVYVLRSDWQGNVSYLRGYNYVRNSRDWDQWTYGLRELETMVEDISSKGDVTRAADYQELAAKLGEKGRKIAEGCEGMIAVKKRIVDREGNLVENGDGAAGWEFSLSATKPVIDKGVHGAWSRDWQVTPTAEEGEQGVIRWRIRSDNPGEMTLVETQQEGFSLYKRNKPQQVDGVFTPGVNASDGGQGEFNAVCTQTLNGETKLVDVKNSGANGFSVGLTTEELKVAHVSCVVDNFESPETPERKVQIKKVSYDPEGVQNSPLEGAKFAVYGAGSAGTIDFNNVVAENVVNEFTISKTGTYYLVETNAPAGHNLLAREVRLDVFEKNGQLEMEVHANSVSDLVQVSVVDGQIVLTVADTKTGELPKTGGLGIWGFAAAGLLLCGVAAAVAVRRK